MILFVLSISLILVCLLKQHPPLAEKKEGAWKTIQAGIQFIRGDNIMLFVMSLNLFSVLFGGVASLLPIYAINILKVGPVGLRVMRMAIAEGATVTILVLVKFPPLKYPWRNLLITIGGFACSIIAFGLWQVCWLSLCFLFAKGAFDSVSVIIRTTIMQTLTPEAMRGRLSAYQRLLL